MGSQTKDLHISKPLRLKSGLVLPNRLVKAAMAEQLGDKSTGLPTDERLLSAYSSWANGGWGLILTGNVHVDRRFLGSPGDVYIDPPSLSDPVVRAGVLDAFRRFAEAAKGSQSGGNGGVSSAAPVIVQINHPGRQSPLGAGSRSFMTKAPAPSAIPLTLGGSGTSSPLAFLLTRLIFGTPRELTIPEIKDIVSRFAETALVLAEAGFDGVEIHAAHGYLLSQFLSARSNKRGDEYGGSPEKRARIVVEIVQAIRERLREDGRFKSFAVGIKVNSVDSQDDGEEGLKELIEQLRLIVDAGVDFVEVSGGSYDDPAMFSGLDSETKEEEEEAGGKKASTLKREAFFQTFSRAIRNAISSNSENQVPLLLTGGFRTRRGMEHALETSDCDLVGIGRPAVINPHLPVNILLNTGEVADQDAIAYAKKLPLRGVIGTIAKWILPRVIGAGYETAWYGEQIKFIGTGGKKVLE